MYAVIISVVYYTQLTTVLYKTADEKILQAFAFSSTGSWLFNLDLLGYGLLSVSTFFLGVTVNVKNRKDKALKGLLLLHGVFFVCMFVPMLPIPSANQGDGGVVALIFFCLFFLPIRVLSVLHFKDLQENGGDEETL